MCVCMCVVYSVVVQMERVQELSSDVFPEALVCRMSYERWRERERREVSYKYEEIKTKSLAT